MRHCSASRTLSGFSLVELSIVLVILGLLVGGILAGQSLIRAAELRSVTTENSRFLTATSAFKDKYFAIPGDFTYATNFGWTNGGNGNGNGLIEAGTPNETSTFWVHLSYAGLIEGNYTYLASGASTIGTHNPKSKLNTAGWNVMWLGTVLPTSGTYYPGNYNNAFLFGAGTTVGVPTGAMKAEEAWNIDTKMDDGRPELGGVRAMESLGGTATTGCGDQAASTAAVAPTTAINYALQNSSTTACALVFRTGY